MQLLLSPWFWKTAAVLVLLGVLGSLCYRAGGASDREALAEYKASQAEQRLLADRAREQRNAARQAAVDQEARRAQSQIVALGRDLDTSRAAGQRLRDAILTALERSGSDTGSAGAGQGKPRGDTARLLAELLERADTRAERVGKYADQLAVAAQACERSYDALTLPNIVKN